MDFLVDAAILAPRPNGRQPRLPPVCQPVGSGPAHSLGVRVGHPGLRSLPGRSASPSGLRLRPELARGHGHSRPRLREIFAGSQEQKRLGGHHRCIASTDRHRHGGGKSLVASAVPAESSSSVRRPPCLVKRDCDGRKPSAGAGGSSVATTGLWLSGWVTFSTTGADSG